MLSQAISPKSIDINCCLVLMFQEILIWIPCLCTILRNTEYLNQQKVTIVVNWGLL
jgi:hypothetical protein